MDAVHRLILALFMVGSFTLGCITGGTLAYRELQTIYMNKIGKHIEKRYTTQYKDNYNRISIGECDMRMPIEVVNSWVCRL